MSFHLYYVFALIKGYVYHGIDIVLQQSIPSDEPFSGYFITESYQHFWILNLFLGMKNCFFLLFVLSKNVDRPSSGIQLKVNGKMDISESIMHSILFISVSKKSCWKFGINFNSSKLNQPNIFLGKQLINFKQTNSKTMADFRSRIKIV